MCVFELCGNVWVIFSGVGVIVILVYLLIMGSVVWIGMIWLWDLWGRVFEWFKELVLKIGEGVNFLWV